MELHDKFIEYVLTIFQPYGGHLDDFGYLIAELIKQEIIIITNERIQLKYIINYDKYMGNGLGGKTIYHLILKYNASNILKTLGEINPLIEYNYYDVYSPKLKIQIECGHTDPKRLLDSIDSDDVQCFWVLQYPTTWRHTWSEHDKNDPAILYKFQVKDICRKILNNIHHESMIKIGKYLTKETKPRFMSQ